MSFQAVSGEYVANNLDTWVYDVYICINDDVSGLSKRKAVVGFTPRQTNGALFWQCNIEEVIKNNYETDKILEIAREYRDLYRPKALCE